VVLCIALGAAAVGIAFGAVDAVLLRPLPYPEADRLVLLWGRMLDGSRDRMVSSHAEFLDWKERSRSFRPLATYNVWFPTLTGTDEPEKLLGATVSADFFPVLGARPLHGRLFTPEDDLPDGEPVVVLAHGLWRRRFGGEPGVVGRRIEIDGRPMTVVGVLPPGFQHPEPIYLDETTEIWTPLALRADASRRRLRFLRVIGRLAPGVPLARAQTEMDGIARALEREHPEENEGHGIQLIPLREQMVGDLRRPLVLALGAAGLILLIACANVSSLLLARATGRAREAAVRAALGAGPARLARPALLESLLLALAGGALGLLLAAWVLPALVAASPHPVPGVAAIGVGARAFAVTFAACAAAALLAALVPALRAARSDPAAVLQEGTPGGGSLRGSRLLAAWVIAEVALALPLLAGAGLLTRSLAGLADTPLGLDPEGVLTLRVELPGSRYKEDEQRLAFHERLLSALSASPGVRAAGITSSLPLTGLFDLQIGLNVERPGGTPEEITAGLRLVSPGYFEALRIPLLAGRTLGPADRKGAPDVALVNQTFVRTVWSGESPIGRTVTLASSGESIEIVGVVGDVRHESPAIESGPEVFVPYAQSPVPFATVVVRGSGALEALVERVRAVLREIDPDIAAKSIRPMERVTRLALAGPRFHAVLAGILAAAALLLAGAGLYGVTAYAVSRRQREIGIRMALGAGRAAVLSLVLRRALVPVFLGALLGLAAAVLLARLLTGLLYGVSPNDPLVFLTATLVPVAVALAAAWLPARRAAAVEPVSAIRE
jgi:putative ABC transport system permease protein